MKKNQYYEEDYDEGDYDYDYEDEYDTRVYAKKEPQKPTPTATKQQTSKQPAGAQAKKATSSAQTTNKAVADQKKPAAVVSTNKQPNSLEKAKSDGQGLQQQTQPLNSENNSNLININATTAKPFNQTHIHSQHQNHNHHHHKTALTIKELNETKYPKSLPDLSLLEISKDEKPIVNLVVIGHVDSGKSTLMGHLLYLMGEIDDRTLNKYEKESKRIGKNTFHFAWAMDEDAEERKRGVTVDIAYKHFQTKTKSVNVMDAPGHKDFIPNMIAGTSAADYALLIVDSGKNSFDAGFFSGGQTKEHAILARSLGVKKLIVCVNKLEIWEWSKDRFDFIKNLLQDYLNGLDFKDEDLHFIPVSGLLGVNIKDRATDVLNKGNAEDKSLVNLMWYEGPSLVELIDTIEAPVRDYESPLRFSISDTGNTTVGSLQGFGIFGKVESGVVYTDQEYLVNPLNFKVKIRAIGKDNEKVNYLKAGMTGELLLHNDKSIPFEEIKAGYTLCCTTHPIPMIKEFKAQILTLEINAPLTIGQTLIAHCITQKGNVKIKKINKIFSRDGKTTKMNSMFVPKNFNAIVTFELEEKFCLELYSNIKPFGRITFRDQGQTIAAGVVLEFIS